MSHVWYIMTEIGILKHQLLWRNNSISQSGLVSTLAPYYTQIHYIGVCYKLQCLQR